jgi:hypothetical protein
VDAEGVQHARARVLARAHLPRLRPTVPLARPQPSQPHLGSPTPRSRIQRLRGQLRAQRLVDSRSSPSTSPWPLSAAPNPPAASPRTPSAPRLLRHAHPGPGRPAPHARRGSSRASTELCVPRPRSRAEAPPSPDSSMRRSEKTASTSDRQSARRALRPASAAACQVSPRARRQHAPSAPPPVGARAGARSRAARGCARAAAGPRAGSRAPASGRPQRQLGPGVRGGRRRGGARGGGTRRRPGPSMPGRTAPRALRRPPRRFGDRDAGAAGRGRAPRPRASRATQARARASSARPASRPAPPASSTPGRRPPPRQPLPALALEMGQAVPRDPHAIAHPSTTSRACDVSGPARARRSRHAWRAGANERGARRGSRPLGQRRGSPDASGPGPRSGCRPREPEDEPATGVVAVPAVDR